jgi:hypothetical protein
VIDLDIETAARQQVEADLQALKDYTTKQLCELRTKIEALHHTTRSQPELTGQVLELQGLCGAILANISEERSAESGEDRNGQAHQTPMSRQLTNGTEFPAGLEKVEADSESRSSSTESTLTTAPENQAKSLELLEGAEDDRSHGCDPAADEAGDEVFDDCTRPTAEIQEEVEPLEHHSPFEEEGAADKRRSLAPALSSTPPSESTMITTTAENQEKGLELSEGGDDDRSHGGDPADDALSDDGTRPPVKLQEEEEMQPLQHPRPFEEGGGFCSIDLVPLVPKAPSMTLSDSSTSPVLMASAAANAAIANARAVGMLLQWQSLNPKQGISRERYALYSRARTFEKFDELRHETYTSTYQQQQGEEVPKVRMGDLTNDVQRGYCTFLLPFVPGMNAGADVHHSRASAEAAEVATAAEVAAAAEAEENERRNEAEAAAAKLEKEKENEGGGC